jgi:hypothetical protein
MRPSVIDASRLALLAGIPFGRKPSRVDLTIVAPPLFNMYNHPKKDFGGIAAKKKIKSLVSSENAQNPSSMSCRSHDQGPVFSPVSIEEKHINTSFLIQTLLPQLSVSQEEAVAKKRQDQTPSKCLGRSAHAMM